MEKELKKCYLCKIEKPLTEYYFDSSRANFYRRCKKCDININEGNKKARDFKNHPRYKAKKAVHIAIKKGILVKGVCVECGESKVHAHHHAGYEEENWLKVTWLCQFHHKEEHRKIKNLK